MTGSLAFPLGSAEVRRQHLGDGRKTRAAAAVCGRPDRADRLRGWFLSCQIPSVVEPQREKDTENRQQRRHGEKVWDHRNLHEPPFWTA